MKSKLIRLVAFALGVTLASGAFGDSSFSAAVSGYYTGGCFFLAFPVNTPSLEWVLSPGSSTVPRFTDDIQAIGSGDGMNVFGIINTNGMAGLRIARVLLGERPFYSAREDFFNGLPEYYGRALAVAKNRRVFAIVSLPGPTLNPRLAVISSAGSLERLFDLPGAFGHLSVAADDCTVYYADHTVIRRVNACTGVSLPLFSIMAHSVTDLAVLSTGDVLVLTGQSLLRLNGDGTPVQSFPIQGVAQFELEAVGVSSDESVVGVAAMRECDFRGAIIALALPDGRELWRQETLDISSATGLVVGTGAAAAIPGLSDVTLALLAAALAALAIRVLRR